MAGWPSRGGEYRNLQHQEKSSLEKLAILGFVVAEIPLVIGCFMWVFYAVLNLDSLSPTGQSALDVCFMGYFAIVGKIFVIILPSVLAQGVFLWTYVILCKGLSWLIKLLRK